MTKKYYTKKERIKYFKLILNSSSTVNEKYYAEMRLKQLLYQEFCIYNTHASKLGVDKDENRYFITLKKKSLIKIIQESI